MNVHTHASPSTHPSVAERFRDHASMAVASIARELQETLEKHYAALGTIDEQVAAVRADKDLSVEAKRRKAAEVKARIQNEAREAIGKVAERAAATVERHLKDMERSLGEFDSLTFSSEIRSFVASLPTVEKRIEFVRDQAARGNKEAVAAVLRHPKHRYLAGMAEMDEEDFSALRADVLGMLDPERAQTISTLRDLAKVSRDAVAGVGFLDRLEIHAVDAA